MTPGSNSSSDLPQEIDKQLLYGMFDKNARWRDSLARALAHKSVDIPLDDDMIGSNNTTNNFFEGRESPDDPPKKKSKKKKSKKKESLLSAGMKIALAAALAGGTGGAGLVLAMPLFMEGGKEIIERVETIDNTREVVPGFGDPW